MVPIRRSFCAALAAVLLALPLFAFKDFVMPHAENAATYPSKDAHANEKVTIALDVYDSSPKDDVFTTHYVQEGILPVFLIVTNDGDKPISVTKMHAQLVTSNRSKLDALTVDDVMRRVAHVNVSSTNPGGRTTPIPIPGTGGKNKKAQQQFDEINRARFGAYAIEPHSTQAGFLFFDIQDVRNPVAGAHLYIEGVRDSGGIELMYFDISVSPQPAGQSGH
jgi:hypothetical protein